MNMSPSEVLILQHSAAEPAGNIETALRSRGLTPRYIRPFAGSPIPESAEGAAALVVMGGPMGVYEADKYPHLRDEMRLIEAALKAEVPVLGVCLGSQLLASVLGSTVAPAPRKEIGWFPVHLSAEAAADPIWSGGPASFVALHWHGDAYDAPAGSVPLASSEITPCQGFRHGASAWGILFHIEATAETVVGMVRDFAEELSAEGIDPRVILLGAHDHLGTTKEIAARVFGLWADRVTLRRWD